MGRNDSTSLWAVIEGLQKRLEDEGLDTEVVDAAITRGIEALLRKRPGPESAFAPWLFAAPAEA